jgi:cytochrome c oxidase subunit 2
MKNPQFNFFPVQASTLASRTDAITFSLLALCGIVALGVFAAIFIFVIRYHESANVNRQIDESSGWKLEILWSIIPLGFFLILFAWGAYTYFEMHSPPAGSTQIYVTGKQWMWKFQHPDGTRELGEVHVPQGKPITLVMTSEDVIHSFFVPAFRMKQDVLPDRYTYTWFEATKVGRYHIFCTQYCGTHHADMSGDVIVMPQAEFQQWQSTGLDRALLRGDGNLVAQGKKAFERHGCVSCHGAGSSVPAPPLEGLYGTQVPLDNGESVLADENYIRESILNPQAKIVRGYQNIMPSFQGQLNGDEVVGLIEYIKSQKPESVHELLQENGGLQ